MQELLGQTFTLADGHYKVVDVRQMSGEAMIYAEKVNTENIDKDDLRPCLLYTSDAADE